MGSFSWALEAQSPSKGHVALVEVFETIRPLTARFGERALEQAVDDGSSLLVVRLDTLGGFMDLAIDIVETIRASGIPTAVYVSPSASSTNGVGTCLSVNKVLPLEDTESPTHHSSPANSLLSGLKPRLYCHQRQGCAAWRGT